MVNGAGVTVYKEFCEEADTIQEHDLLFIVDPTSGVLTQVFDWKQKGVVHAVTLNQIDLTEVATLIGFTANPWETSE